MADWTSLNYVVVDVEGNGQQPPDLVELATVPIVDGIIGEPTSWLVHPERPIKYFATRIHGLTNKDVADAPVFTAVKEEVLRALDGAALVAHNAHIDVSVLDRTLGDWQHPEVFDTLKLARRLLPPQESYRLGALVERFKLAEQLSEGLIPHRASYDALVTARLFVRLATLPGAHTMSLLH
jgi:exodeoxyribonuclease X